MILIHPFPEPSDDQRIPDRQDAEDEAIKQGNGIKGCMIAPYRPRMHERHFFLTLVLRMEDGDRDPPHDEEQGDGRKGIAVQNGIGRIRVIQHQDE